MTQVHTACEVDLHIHPCDTRHHSNSSDSRLRGGPMGEVELRMLRALIRECLSGGMRNISSVPLSRL